MLYKMLDDMGILLWCLLPSFSVILGKLLFNLSNFCQVKRIIFTTESILNDNEQKTFIKAALQQQWAPLILTLLK